MKAIGRLLSGLVVFGAAAALATYRGDLSTFHAGLSIGAVVFAVLGLAIENVGRRVRLLYGLLLATCVLTGARALDYDLLGDDPWRSRIYAAVLTTSCVIAAVGLSRRAPWGRWLVLALGLGGVVSGGMNVANGASFFVHWDHQGYDRLWLWSNIMLTTGSFAIVLLASGKAMKSAFGKPFTPSEPTTIWSAAHPLVGAVRIALITGFAAGDMSLIYALGQPLVPQTVTTSLILAGSFLVAALLTIARKTIGVLLLVVTGFGFLAQAAATYVLAGDAGHHTAMFYGVFWLGAGLAATYCGLRLVLAKR